MIVILYTFLGFALWDLVKWAFNMSRFFNKKSSKEIVNLEFHVDSREAEHKMRSLRAEVEKLNASISKS